MILVISILLLTFAFSIVIYGIIRYITRNFCEEEKRYLQFPILPFVVIYSLIIFAISDDLNQIILSLSDWLFQKVPFLSGIIPCIIIILNIIVLLLYYFFRRTIAVFLLALWERIDYVKEVITQLCYVKIKDNWYIKKSLIPFNRILKYIEYLLIILTALYFILSFISCRTSLTIVPLYPGTEPMFIIPSFNNGAQSIFLIPIYPVLTLLIISEFRNYFGGKSLYTKKDKDRIHGSNDDVDSEYNYAKLRMALTKQYRDEVLAQGSREKTLDYSDQSYVYIQKLIESNNAQERLLGKYYHAMSQKEHIDSQYVKAVQDMMNHQSIIFSTPFYKDLTIYLFFVIHRFVLRKEKVLFIVGRDTIVDDVKAWVNQSLSEVAKSSYLWDVVSLSDQSEAIDVGLISISQLYDFELYEANREFLDDVHLAIFIEPSRILATAQPALYLLTRTLNEQAQYVIFDKNSDGLVDALSHILKTNLTEVAATKFGALATQYVIWNGDAKNMHKKNLPMIVRYLGVGSEIATMCLRHGLQQIDWLAYQNFPVVDMKWILGQYYASICEYAGIPGQQHRLNEYLSFIPNIWGSEKRQNHCAIVEDEYYNVFEMVRQFSTRGREQMLVNVISPNYMLRDYMCDNYLIFENDAKAIPNFVPDYARSKRNVILEIIMQLSIHKMSKNAIMNQLEVAYEVKNNMLEVLYAGIKHYILGDDEYDLNELIIEEETKTHADDEVGYANVIYYSIQDKVFIQKYLYEFRNAKYIAEDESKQIVLKESLYGLLYQKFLPKQLITIQGKYFEVIAIENDLGVRLRRASDHIHSRIYYRQIRHYYLETISSDTQSYSVHGVQIEAINANINVETPSYYELKQYQDLAHARLIELGDNIKRQYKEKKILKLTLPDCDYNTITNIVIVLNELLISIFPNNYQYLSVVCALNEDDQNALRGIVASVSGDIDDKSIYVIEDSQLDLGLLITFERNLERFFEIICDYLTWQIDALIPTDEGDDEEKMEVKDEIKEVVIIPLAKKPNIFKRIWNRLRRRKKSLSNVDGEMPASDDSEEANVEEISGTIDEISQEVDEISQAVDEAMEEIIEESEEEVSEEVQCIPDFSKPHYLQFGYENGLPQIQIEVTLAYLTKLGLADNSLKQARENVLDMDVDSYKPNLENVLYCDFCGRVIEEYDDYDRLSDGRYRCSICRLSAVRTKEEFENIFYLTKANYEAFFKVKFDVVLDLEMLDSKELHDRLGVKYDPHNGRTLGVAKRNRDGYKIYIENGAPRAAFIATLVHELTHIWQYQNWNDSLIQLRYGNQSIAVYEGMAKWVEIQYLYLIGENAYAKRNDVITIYRDDEYGLGYRSYRSKYQFSKTSYISHKTPFDSGDSPL